MTARERSPAPDLASTYRDRRLALLRLAYLLCGSHEQAEDAVQSAFAGAQAHWDRIEDHPAYLRRAVVNQVKDEQRRRLRWRGRAVPTDPQVVLPPEVDETWTAVRRLRGVQRTVVVLHYYEDLPLTEVADLLGRPAATVRSDHRRALEKLRKALS